MEHYSVLYKEVILKLQIKEDGIYVDATLGLGGHTGLMAKLAFKGRIISFDQDPNALAEAKKRLSKFDNITFIKSNFRNLKSSLKAIGIDKVDGVLYDLGTSYYQLKDTNRGFTYHGETTLDMRMNPDNKLSAVEVLNDYPEEELTKIFFDYGDEKQSRKIAGRIVEHRNQYRIETNSQLNDIIKSVKGYVKEKHPSKNIFQAIRIEVNDEINAIKESLAQAVKLLKKDGRVLVITFHSLEDKVVKDMFWQYKKDIDITQMGNNHKYKTLKTIYPTKEEVLENRPSRSAKLRIMQKLIN